MTTEITGPQDEPSTVWGRLGRDLAAPFSDAGMNFLVMGSALTVASYAAKPYGRDMAADRPLGSASKFGYQLGFWKTDAVYIGALGLWSLIMNDGKASHDALFALRATVYTALSTQAITMLKLEDRPRGRGEMNSFPSGHASNSFALAGSIVRNHGWYVGAPAMAVASFVAVSRVNDNAHYIHDVVFGATLGLSYAFGLDNEWTWKGHRSISLAPEIDGDSFGMNATLKF
jgi:hypothetical protein